MKYLKISLFTGLALLCFNSKAQDVKVEAKLERSSMMMGDQTTLRLTATIPANSKIDFPVLSDTLSAKVQIVKLGNTDTIKNPASPDLISINRQYIITSFDTGLQMIPSFTFTTSTGTFNTNALPLQVNAVKVDTSKGVYDIKEPLAVKYNWVDWIKDHIMAIELSALGLLLVIGLIWLLAKRKKSKPVVNAPAKPLIPIHQLALQKLQELKQSQLWQQNEMKLYHSSLTDILREYLEKRYQINALEQTTEEIFKSLRNKDISDDDRKNLKELLVLADLVKFAKEKPLSTENEQSMESAINFIKNTRQIETVTENKKQQ
ncbi:hypothetical protein LPB86_13655 [Pedobacter sp. MC2016-14]|uniref:hypothetical protein n=1 Tax=Pedobacter sp. MC2016-14 TaxID=2897327 RepID=UPI001E5F4E0C|nr:hypothetical protein [Pedobacter sp. MC2016-14]MCD0489281.1 hypothetical protein [Pedobacter sp. MC2016-14]